VLVEPSRGAHANFDSVGLKVVVPRLPRIGGHSDGFVAEIFDLINRARHSERAAGGVVVNERSTGAAHDAPVVAPTGVVILRGRPRRRRDCGAAILAFSAASRLAMSRWIEATVILRDRPSRKLSSSPAAINS